MAGAPHGFTMPMPEPKPEPEVIERTPESDVDWRYKQYRHAGVSIENAELLARADVDWHRIVDLLSQGVDELTLVHVFV